MEMELFQHDLWQQQSQTKRKEGTDVAKILVVYISLGEVGYSRRSSKKRRVGFAFYPFESDVDLYDRGQTRIQFRFTLDVSAEPYYHLERFRCFAERNKKMKRVGRLKKRKSISPNSCSVAGESYFI